MKVWSSEDNGWKDCIVKIRKVVILHGIPQGYTWETVDSKVYTNNMWKSLSPIIGTVSGTIDQTIVFEGGLPPNGLLQPGEIFTYIVPDLEPSLYPFFSIGFSNNVGTQIIPYNNNALLPVGTQLTFRRRSLASVAYPIIDDITLSVQNDYRSLRITAFIQKSPEQPFDSYTMSLNNIYNNNTNQSMWTQPEGFNLIVEHLDITDYAVGDEITVKIQFYNESLRLQYAERVITKPPIGLGRPEFSNVVCTNTATGIEISGTITVDGSTVASIRTTCVASPNTLSTENHTGLTSDASPWATGLTIVDNGDGTHEFSGTLTTQLVSIINDDVKINTSEPVNATDVYEVLIVCLCEIGDSDVWNYQITNTEFVQAPIAPPIVNEIFWISGNWFWQPLHYAFKTQTENAFIYEIIYPGNPSYGHSGLNIQYNWVDEVWLDSGSAAPNTVTELEISNVKCVKIMETGFPTLGIFENPYA